MGGTNPIFIAALLTASVGMSQAGENDPFIYFATQDPFVSPEAPITKNDVHLFGGVFAEGSFGSVAQVWDADYTDNFMIGGIYGRDLKDLGAGFVLGGVAGAAIRFGDDDDTTGEGSGKKLGVRTFR